MRLASRNVSMSHGIGRYDLFELDDVLKLLEEEHVDFGAVVDQRQIDAAGGSAAAMA